MAPRSIWQTWAAVRVLVTDLRVYPVKSTRGASREHVRVAATGLEWDRQWMIVNERGTFLSQRTHPQLARIVPEVRETELLLSAPGLTRLQLPLDGRGASAAVQVWKDACTGVDQGDEASAWLGRAVGETVRLVRVAPDMRRFANPEFAGTTPAPLAFPDGYPILVCNEASLADLNARLPQPVPMERFRPNVILTGLPAWAEDEIDTISIGPVTLRLVKPCTRCRIPSIDQRSGEPSTDPVPELRKFRFSRKLRGVMFGENAVIVAGVGAELARGAPCRITTDSAPARFA